MTLKQLAGIHGINNALITLKIQNINKNFNKLFKSLMLSEVKFNDLDAISRYLTALITPKY